MARIERPVRVLTHEVRLFTCPACKRNVDGVASVEVHVGEVTDVDNDGNAEVAVTTRLRGIAVAHDCSINTAHNAEEAGR